MIINQFKIYSHLYWCWIKNDILNRINILKISPVDRIGFQVINHDVTHKTLYTRNYKMKGRDNPLGARALTWTLPSRTLCAARWNVIRRQGGDHMTHKRVTSACRSAGDDPEVLQMHRASIHHICGDAMRTGATLTGLVTFCRWPAQWQTRSPCLTHISTLFWSTHTHKKNQHPNTSVVACVSNLV